MTAIQRNHAASVSRGTRGAKLGPGGSGRAPLSLGADAVESKWRRPDDPAAELMPAAEFLGHETDFGAILEDFEGSPLDPAKRRVLGRLMGMFAMDYQGARPEERRFLRRLLRADNPREAYVANRSLHLCASPHVLRRTLALGVAESRFASEPTRGFLSAVQARIAVTTFRLLGPRGREQVWQLLMLAGFAANGTPIPGSDRIIERALVLKALAARRHRLGPWAQAGGEALAEIEAFASLLRGQSRETLGARTCLHAGDPERLPPAQSIPSDAIQRAAVLTRGDIDPVFAWNIHGYQPQETQGKKRETLERDEAMPELDRSAVLDRPRLHMALAEARTHSGKALSDKQVSAIADYIAGRDLSSRRLALKDEGAALLTERGFDVPPTTALDAIRQDAQGIYKFDAARAFSDLLSRFSGATYVRRVFSDQLTAGTDPLGQIGRALSQGLAVPLTINELRSPVTRALAALVGMKTESEWMFAIREPQRNLALQVPGSVLLATVLPEPFGQHARADAYLAPAALDLLAPPFGIPFPKLGIEDKL